MSTELEGYGARHIALREEVAAKLTEAKYHGAVTDALRRATRANPEINEALCAQVEALIEAADLYDAGIAAGEFADGAKGRPKKGAETRHLTQADLGLDHRRISEGRKLRERDAASFIREHIDESIALGNLLRGGRVQDVHYSSATDVWSTPQDLFDELNAEFGFTLDVCATPDNAKCSAFFTEQHNGLDQEWRGVCWMNPPYGDAIAQWVEKAYESAKTGATVVCLVPARVDTGWWWRWCRFGEVRFLRGRLKFGGGDNSAPFPSALVIFGRPANILDAHWERAA